ncbi:hypothetical protein PHISP_06687 [Aspergillus sp. HF37]|nr:hypothetical protein PHISP_06687 [Aspergillus sp. HF37]
MALKTGRLERKYEQSLLHSMQLLDAERSRAKHVEQLYLEFENHDLRSQLDRASDELIQTTKVAHEAASSCSIKQTSSHTSDDLHKEIASLRKAATESERHLAEKSALSEKLSKMQSELARLEKQNTSTQPHAAEKHDLQRQLDTLKGQLENGRTKESQQVAEIADLTKRLEETRRQLSGETDSRSRQEHNVRQERLEWEKQQTALESKLESLQQKLKSMKDQLHEAKSNVRDRNSRPEDRGASRTVPTQQRPSTRYNADMAIGTPGPVKTHVGTKKPTAPGEKSGFSITPFLNRTSAFQDPPSSSEDDPEEPHEESDTEKRPSKGKATDRGRASNPNPQSEDVQDSPIRRNADTSEPKRGKAPTDTNPDMATNHSDRDDEVEDAGALRQPTGPMGKPKKRKLGAQRDNSPDDDLGSVKKPGRKLALGGGSRPARLPRSRVFSGPTDFSPLKRDRR